MLRHLVVGVLIGLVASSGCAGLPLVVRTDAGQVVMVDLQSVRPVEYGAAELREAMGLFAEHLATVIRNREGQLRVRLTASDPMAEAYLAWCGRRNAPGDCLELLDGKSAGLSNDGKRSIAVRMALGKALDEVASVVRHVDPVKVEAVLLIWFTIYFASLVFPDVAISKSLAFVMSANMVAFLGWDGFRSFVLGYRDMCRAADASRTFAELYDAGRAYGDRMGPSMVRLVTALVTLGLSSATGMSVPVTRLPGGAQAAANAQAMGFRLGAVSTGSVAVSATGTVTLVVNAEAVSSGALSSPPQTSAGSAVLPPPARLVARPDGKVLDVTKVRIPGPRNSAQGKLDYLLGKVPSQESVGKGGFFEGVLGFDKSTLGSALERHLIENFGMTSVQGFTDSDRRDHDGRQRPGGDGLLGLADHC
jgi:hypothetical protein